MSSLLLSTSKIGSRLSVLEAQCTRLLRISTGVIDNFTQNDDETSSPSSAPTKEDLQEMMHGRKKRERRDSVTDEMLLDRYKHNNRMILLDESKVSANLLSKIENLGLGSKKRKSLVYSKISLNNYSEPSNKTTLTGAGGFAVHLTSTSGNWPIFKHILPEISFAGHSNCGKSTLVNGISGLHPKKGPASVSDRAGWTDQICFYQLGKKPPILIMADLPGYGHSVSTALIRAQWKTMIRDYLSTRIVLSRCCVLVDCTRGLCDGDYSILKFLQQNGVPWQIVLTKCDLLTTIELAKCVTIINDDLKNVTKRLNPDDNSEDENDLLSNRIMLVSASTGAGIHQLWLDLKKCAHSTSISPSPTLEHVVREHENSEKLRRKVITDSIQKRKTSRYTD